MKYFNGITNLDELKKAYRKLAMQYHPDCGGDLEIMKQINAEHDELFEILKKQQNTRAAADETGRTKATTETAEEFRDIIMKLLALDGLEIELCGRWLWVGGNTKEHKDKLKAWGLHWCSKKKLWSWHHPEEGSRSRRTHDMGYIRSKYGSETISSDSTRTNSTRTNTQRKRRPNTTSRREEIRE